jgi:signal transduction histidine kinase
MIIGGQSASVAQLSSLPWNELVYHACTVGSAWWLLIRARLTGTVFSSVVAGQAVLGIMVLSLTVIEPSSAPVMRMAWVVLTIFMLMCVCMVLLSRYRREPSPNGVFLLLVALWGLGLVLDDLLPWLLRGQALGLHTLNVVHALWLGAVVLISLQISGRLALWKPQAHAARSAVDESLPDWWADPANQASHIAGFHALSPLSSVDLSSNAASIVHDVSWLSHADEQRRTLSEERKRIAQDIHDGVGSQLTSLIAGLDQQQPSQRQLALNLESCLVGLKTTVDRLDEDSDTNIFDELGRLRYRFHPALMRAGIRLHWRVEPHGPLMRLTSQQRQHVQRFAQEALTNVLVHSQARNVRLACRFEDSPQPRMLLEIVDNGVGISQAVADARNGRGLSGYYKRAQQLDAELRISTQEGVGTRIRLLVPIATDEYKA